MKIEFKDGTLIGLFTDYTISKSCPTCTYGMVVIREIIFRIKQGVIKDYKLEKESEYDDDWEIYDYEKGANFVDIVSFFNKDFQKLPLTSLLNLSVRKLGLRKGFNG